MKKWNILGVIQMCYELLLYGNNGIIPCKVIKNNIEALN